MENPDNSRILVRMIATCWGEDHDVGFCPGVEAILSPANVVGGVIYSECPVLVNAVANDLESGSIVASEVGICRIVWFISEAGQEMILQLSVEVLQQCSIGRRMGLDSDPLTLSATSPGYLASQSTRLSFWFLSSKIRWCFSGGLYTGQFLVATPRGEWPCSRIFLLRSLIARIIRMRCSRLAICAR